MKILYVYNTSLPFYYYLKGKEQQRNQLWIGWALLHDSIWGDRKVWNDYDIFEMDINYEIDNIQQTDDLSYI